MKRTCLQRNTIEDQRELNTDEHSRYSSGIGEFHSTGILLKEQHFDPEGKQQFKRFIRIQELFNIVTNKETMYYKFVRCLMVVPLLVALFFVSCQSSDIEKIKAFTHPPGAPEVVADTLQILYSDSAVIRFKLECPKVLIYQDEEEPFNEFPQGFKITQFDKNKKITSSITASYGKYYEKKELWEAKQNVVAITEKGDSLKTELLYWDEKKEKIYTNQFVHIVRKDEDITGTGFESDIQMTRWKITNVKGPVVVEVEE